MSSRKQREKIRERRMEFDRKVAESRSRKAHLDEIGNMTKAQLIKYAEEKGIEIDKTAKKAEIFEKVTK